MDQLRFGFFLRFHLPAMALWPSIFQKSNISLQSIRDVVLGHKFELGKQLLLSYRLQIRGPRTDPGNRPLELATICVGAVVPCDLSVVEGSHPNSHQPSQLSSRVHIITAPTKR